MPAADPPLVVIDANVFDRIGPGDDERARAFRRLIDAGRLRLVVPAGVATEVAHPRTPATTRASLQAPVLPRVRRTAREEIDRIRVRAILRGDGRPGKHDADAGHLSDAAESGCSFFVTADGKLLRKRDILASSLPPRLRSVTLAELLAAVADDR